MGLLDVQPAHLGGLLKHLESPLLPHKAWQMVFPRSHWEVLQCALVIRSSAAER